MTKMNYFVSFTPMWISAARLFRIISDKRLIAAVVVHRHNRIKSRLAIGVKCKLLSRHGGSGWYLSQPDMVKMKRMMAQSIAGFLIVKCVLKLELTQIKLMRKLNMLR